MELTRDFIKRCIKYLRPLNTVEGNDYLEFMKTCAPRCVVPGKQLLDLLKDAQNKRKNFKYFFHKYFSCIFNDWF